jgi:hypothetical protein
VVPVARAGFVPYHLGELFGANGPRTWYVILGGVLVAVIVAALLPVRDRIASYLARVALVGLFAWIGLRPALAAPLPNEAGDDGVSARSSLTTGWEPPGRDRLSTLRSAAERGDRCAWFRLADLERALARPADADRDEQRAEQPRESCNLR